MEATIKACTVGQVWMPRIFLYACGSDLLLMIMLYLTTCNLVTDLALLMSLIKGLRKTRLYNDECESYTWQPLNTNATFTATDTALQHNSR